MNVKKFRTTEEKQALMKGFLTSGKPRTVWCKETNIPVTTFVGWMKADEKAKKEVCFIPLKPKKKKEKGIHSSLVDHTESISSLILEIDSCKIHVTEYIPMPFLAEVLKVVKSAHV